MPHTPTLMPLLVALTALLPLLGPAPASAATTVPAGVVYGVDLVPGRGLLALAGGESGVITTRSDHSVQAVAGGLGSIRHVAGLPDGTVLATSQANNDIVRVDAITGKVVRRYTLPPGFCPTSLAATGRYAYFTGECFDHDAGVLDLDTGAVTSAFGVYKGIVTSSPALPGRVLVTEQGMSQATVVLLDISSGQARWLAGRTHEDTLWDARISPDGRLVALADMRWRTARVWHTSDLTDAAQLPSVTTSPRAVTWLDNQRLAVGGLEDAAPIALFDLATPSTAVDLPRSLPDRHYVCARCLAPGARAGQLVAASLPYFEGAPALQTLGTSPTSLTLQAPEQVQLTRPVTLTAQLRHNGAVPPPGTAVRFFRKPEYTSDPAVLIGTGTVDSSGTVTFSDTPPQRSLYRYSAQYDSDGTHATNRAERLVDIMPAPASLTASFTRTATKGKQISGNLDIRLTPVVEVRDVHVEVSTGRGTAYAGTSSVDGNGALRLPLTFQPPAQVTVSFFGGGQQADARTSLYVQK